MKKKIAQILSLIIISFSMFGLSSCVGIRELKLAKIETQGEYIMRQGAFLNQGTKRVNIKDAILKKIRREKGFWAVEGEHYDDMNYCEKDGVIYFIYRYKKEVDFDAMNSQRNDFHTINYYAFGKTSVMDVNLTISGYFESAIEYSDNEIYTIGFLGHYAVFGSYYTDKLFAYDCSTLQMREIFVEGYEYDSHCDTAVVLSKKEENATDYRIYDKSLMEYQYTYTGTAAYSEPFEEYMLFYDYDKVSSEYSMESVVNFKTNSTLSEEDTASKWQEFRAYREATVRNYDFSYKDKQYTFEYGNERENENGERQYFESDVLTITDIQTGQRYSATDEELWASAPVMSQIQEIYDGEFDCCQIFSQDNELFFVFVSDETFFGIGTSKTSPRIVFKYNEMTRRLDYIGHASYTFYSVTHIYKGNL